MFRFKKKEKLSVPLEVPKHIGIIMDGNVAGPINGCNLVFLATRLAWSSARSNHRSQGDGSASPNGLCFLNGNWTRPQQEVSFIMNLPVEFYDRFVPELHRNNVKIQMIGEVSRLPKETLEALEKAEALTHSNTGLILNFALNYGGRAELTQAVKQIAQEVLDAHLNPGDISEEIIANYLYTSSLPKDLRDPDLIIRTSGELRLE